MYCNNCGKNNPEGSKFCQHCGIKMTEKNTINTSSEQKSSHAGAWIVGIIVILVIIGFIWMLASSSSSSSTNKLPTTSAGTSTDTNTTPALDAFKTNYQSSFIQSCENSAGGANSSGAICTCVANYLVNNYNDVQLTNITAKYKLTGKTPQEMTDAVASCTSTGSSSSNQSNQSPDEITYGNNFMNSCNSQGNLYTQCSCLLTYLRNNYTLAQRVQM